MSGMWDHKKGDAGKFGGSERRNRHACYSICTLIIYYVGYTCNKCDNWSISFS